MQLTGNQIIEKNIITDYDTENSIQQQGIDLRVSKISRVSSHQGTKGFIPATGKTILPSTVLPLGLTNNIYKLDPGYYEIEFIEGCKIPNNIAMQLKSRSSLVRCGCDVRSGQFDAGFKTDHIGAYLKVELAVEIEYGARIAQALLFESEEVENTYNGQWQGDKQRNNKPEYSEISISTRGTEKIHELGRGDISEDNMIKNITYTAPKRRPPKEESPKPNVVERILYPECPK